MFVFNTPRTNVSKTAFPNQQKKLTEESDTSSAKLFFQTQRELRQGLKTTHTTSPQGRKHPPNPQSNGITFQTEEGSSGKSCS